MLSSWSIFEDFEKDGIEPDFQDKGYGTALLKHLREIQGNRPIVLTIFTPDPDNDDYEECLRRKWFYVKNGYVDQKIPYPDGDNHRFDIHMNGYGIGYIELMAMLNKVNMFFNTLIIGICKLFLYQLLAC